MKNLICMSIFSGLMIGLGDIVFIECLPEKILGSFLFSVGLISVIIYGGQLFTGKIGYWPLIPLKYLGIILGINLITIWITCFGWSFCHTGDIPGFIAVKCDEGPWEAFLRATGCGACMWLAVEGWSRTKNYLIVILPVMLFILSGFDHCIANAGYLGFARTFDWNLIPWILGNSVGSLFLSILIRVSGMK